MTIFGMLRVKNEARWIERVVNSILPLCERVFILDDHSDDGTPEFCERIERCTVIRSGFEGLDESRDKDFLLQRLMCCVSNIHLSGSERSPFWALAIDGDEVLEDGGAAIIRQTLEVPSRTHAYKLPIRYLWNSEKQFRVDGVYGRFARPSLFRLMNAAFRFQRTPWGGNFHCSSIPQELLHHAHAECPARLWHLGYMTQEDRLRKYRWYNEIDPGNQAEDCYRHMVQGDILAVPAEARLKWAGPLQIANI